MTAANRMRRDLIAFALLLPGVNLTAARVFETDGHVIYEDEAKRKVKLGAAFSPVLTSTGKVALIRGRQFAYGETFNCEDKTAKNWIAIYDPVSATETVLFDRARLSPARTAILRVLTNAVVA